MSQSAPSPLKPLIGGKGGRRRIRKAVKKVVKDELGAEFLLNSTGNTFRNKLPLKSFPKARKVGGVSVRGRNYVVGKNNAADPRNRLRSLGRTGPGRCWALHALHPCGEDIPGIPLGIPDRVTLPVACPLGRSFTNIKMPSLPDRTFGTGATAYTIKSPWLLDTQTLWDVEIVLIASAVGRVVFQATPDGVFVDEGFQAPFGAHTTPGVWSRIPLKDPSSATDPLPVGYWNAYTVIDVPVIPIGQSSNLMQSFRVMFMGITIHLDVATLQNQGRVIAGQVGNDYKLVGVNEAWASVVQVDPNSVRNISVPTSDNDLTQQDPLAYNQPAKNGVYMPLRITEPVVEMQDTVANATDGKYNNAFIINNNQHDGSADLDHNPQFFTDQLDPSWALGIIFFRGISNQATLDIKTRIGYECTVASGSNWKPFSNRSPLLDVQAIDAVATLSQEMAHAYPASYNDLGKIVDSIGSAIESSGLPVVSDIARAVRPFATGIAKILSDLLG